jgi:hypothetical protein
MDAYRGDQQQQAPQVGAPQTAIPQASATEAGLGALTAGMNNDDQYKALWAQNHGGDNQTANI